MAAEVGVGEAGGADHGVQAVLGGEGEVLARRVGDGEVDDHLRAGVDERVGRRGHLEVRCRRRRPGAGRCPRACGSTAATSSSVGVGRDGLAHRATHAPCRAEHPHPDHVARPEAHAGRRRRRHRIARRRRRRGRRRGAGGGGGGGGSGAGGGGRRRGAAAAPGAGGGRRGGGAGGAAARRRGGGGAAAGAAGCGGAAARAAGRRRRRRRWRLLLGAELAVLGLVGGQLAEHARDVGVGLVEAALVLGVGPRAELAQQAVRLALRGCSAMPSWAALVASLTLAAALSRNPMCRSPSLRPRTLRSVDAS